MASSVFLFPGNITFGGPITSTGVTSNGNVLISGTNLLQMGGTTNQSPALKGNAAGTALAIRGADDAAANSINGFNIFSQGGFYAVNNLLINAGTAPTISSGFGTSPSIANNNGSSSFVVNVGTGGAATSGVLTLPAAATGWILHCIDITAAAGHTGLRTVQTASTTTTATIESQNSAGTATAWATGSLVRIIATAF